MHIAVIGAGFAGLSTVKVLTHFGFDVTVFDKASIRSRTVIH